ncbi:hypothetical protein AGMMS49975_27470 [Clostridia bacterium]|nr:hypothetical protein AGMMS49975_27470 [Clostridia bacterium]
MPLDSLSNMMQQVTAQSYVKFAPYMSNMTGNATTLKIDIPLMIDVGGVRQIAKATGKVQLWNNQTMASGFGGAKI